MPDQHDCIILWNVHFDDDVFSYTTLHIENVFQNIITFLDYQINDSIANKTEIVDDIMKNIRHQIAGNSTDAMTMIVIGKARICVKRSVLDNRNPIYIALSAAYSQVDDQTKSLISKIITQQSSF